MSKDLFTMFWQTFPSRDGHKDGKQATHDLFIQLSPEDQSECIVAASRYAQHCKDRRKWPINPRGFFIHRTLGLDYWKRWSMPKQPQVRTQLPQDGSLQSMQALGALISTLAATLSLR